MMMFLTGDEDLAAASRFKNRTRGTTTRALMHSRGEQARHARVWVATKCSFLYLGDVKAARGGDPYIALPRGGLGRARRPAIAARPRGEKPPTQTAHISAVQATF